MNTQIKNLESQIINAINTSGVEIAVVSLILEKLLNESNLILAQVMDKENEQQTSQDIEAIKSKKEDIEQEEESL